MPDLPVLSDPIKLRDRRKAPALYRMSTLVYAFIAVIVLVGILLYVHGFVRYQQHQESRQALAENIVNAAGSEIESFIADGNQNLSNFAEAHIDLLKKMAIDPDKGGEEYFFFDDHLQGFFPEVISFNLADADGNLIDNEWADFINEACIKDVRKFINNNNNYLAYAHLQAGHYHFDLMTKVSLDGEDIVLFVSQPLAGIEKVIEQHKIHGLTLILYNSVIDKLIEVSEHKVRDHVDAVVLQHQHQSEKQEVYARRTIHNSNWILRAHTDNHQEIIFKLSLIRNLAMMYAGFLLLAILAFLFALRMNNSRINLFKHFRRYEEAIADQHLTLPLPYDSIDADFNVRRVNKAWCDMLGYEVEEVIGQPFSNYISEEGMAQLKARSPKYAIKGGIDHDIFTMRHKSGDLIEVDVSSRFEYDMEGKFLYANSILSNLTEKRQASDRISSLEQRHSMHWHQTMVGVIEWDNDLRVIDWNPAAEEIFGFSKAEAKGLKAEDFIFVDSAINKVEHVWQEFLTHEGGEHEINKNLTKDNQVITCEWFNTKITDGSGKVVGISSLVLDITTQTEYLEVVSQHEQELSQLVDSMVDAVITIDETGTMLSFNRSAEKIFGYPAEDVIGHNVNQLMPEPDHSQHDSYLANYLTSGNTNIIGSGREVEAKRKNGEVFPLRLSVSELPQQAGKARRFIGSCIDISEQRKMEDAIRQTRKLEAIGGMAGGIAHDFNNLLGIISGNLEILKRYSGDNAGMNKWIDSAIKTTNRGAVLTKRLLGFSRAHQGEVKTVSIRDMLKDMHSVIEKTAGIKVDVCYELADNVWLTDIDSGDFEDAMINLVINAKDAMKGAGKLDVVANNIVLSKNKVSNMPGIDAGDYVVMCVSDSGTGISKEIQQRIFDPFYSTKEKSKGTGLGLSMVHGFARRSKGYVEVVSELGSGTAIYLYLPRSTKDKIKKLDYETNKTLPTGTETILVVDDEAQLVDVASIYLGELGYQVLQATDTERAIALLQGNEKIDLLFSDIIMPGDMDGFALSEAALKLRPELKVLLVSGYTPEDSDLSVASKRLASMRLNKPYNKAELAQCVRLILDGVSESE